LVTYNNDPRMPTYLHHDKLRYLPKSEDSESKESLFFLIERSHIKNGYIELSDLSIMKTKAKDFDFKLIPYDLDDISPKIDICMMLFS